MISFKNYALAVLAGLSLLQGVNSEKSTMTGYLMDNKCLELCQNAAPFAGCTPDGSNSFYTPAEHTGKYTLVITF